MGILSALSSFALRQVVGEGADRLVSAITDRTNDQSQLLTQALERANDRAWRTFEIALAGDSLLNKLDAAEDKAFRQQVRTLLDAMPLPGLNGKNEFRRFCLAELQDARKKGKLLGHVLPEDIAKSAGAFAHQGDPQKILAVEKAAQGEVAATLKKDGYANLAWLIDQEVQPGQSLLVLSVQYFFRREVESNPTLARRLEMSKVENLTAAQQATFQQLDATLAAHGRRMEQLLGGVLEVVTQTRDAVLDIQAEQQQQTGQLADIYRMLQQLMEQTQMQQRREVRPGDSRSLRGEGEKRRVNQLAAQIAALPDEQRREHPAMINAMGLLQVAAGESESAQKNFDQVAAIVADDPKAKAQVRYNAYQAALERRDFPAALEALREAAQLHPQQYTPFPFETYAPERILGAGGFGVAFLCQQTMLKRSVVVKCLRIDGIDRDVDDVFREARVLDGLEHSAIIRLRDCQFADAARTRPYLVMDFFEGATLNDHVVKNGTLSSADLLPIAKLVAEALQAAHAQNILHRDVKPDNLLIRIDSQGSEARRRAKLIDFGLALKQETAEGTVRSHATPSPTPHDAEIAGTIDYAAPEQMGRLPGVGVGTYSDVYGFGKTCYFALLGTPEPDDSEKDTLEPAWRKFLSQCTARKIDGRLRDFAAVLDKLRELEAAPVAAFAPRPVQPPRPVVKKTPVVETPPAPVLDPRKPPVTPQPPLSANRPSGVPPRYLGATPPSGAKGKGGLFGGLWSGQTPPPAQEVGASDLLDEPGSELPVENQPLAPPPKKPKKSGLGGAFFAQNTETPAEETPVEELPPLEMQEPPPTQAPPSGKKKRDHLGGAFNLSGE